MKGGVWELARSELGRTRWLRQARIHFDPARCTGVYECYEVCPVGCWVPDRVHHTVVFAHGERCVACGACVLQCPRGAIELR